MSMHRVSEHREEDEEDDDTNLHGKKRSNQRLSGMKVTNGGDDDEIVSGQSSPDKFGSRKISGSNKKKHQPLMYNAWVSDEENKDLHQEAEGEAGAPGNQEDTESPMKKKMSITQPVGQARHQSQKPPIYSYAGNQ